MLTLVLFGRPASGKGTLGQHLSDAEGFRACSTGAAMRAWAAGPDPEQVELRRVMAAGGYGSDELAVRIVQEFIVALPADVPGVILDGFPRDRAQLHAWLAFPADHGVAVVVDTPADVCRDRVQGRMVCVDCGWTGHVPATTCELCGHWLERRTDDLDAAAFDRRQAEYEARTAPLVDAWAEAGLPMIRLDGTLPADTIAAELMAVLQRLPAPVAAAR
jgi:adenylate kinase